MKILVPRMPEAGIGRGLPHLSPVSPWRATPARRSRAAMPEDRDDGPNGKYDLTPTEAELEEAARKPSLKHGRGDAGSRLEGR